LKDSFLNLVSTKFGALIGHLLGGFNKLLFLIHKAKKVQTRFFYLGYFSLDLQTKYWCADKKIAI